jgi:uncharacterized protein (TIGR03083 family)
VSGALPVLTAPLFRPLHVELVTMLRGLPQDAWQRPTSAPGWKVRDVAAHLLDVDVRRISIQRDRHRPSEPATAPAGTAGLLRYLDALNAQWVEAGQRISGPLLIDLLAVTGPLLADLMESADPHAPATFPVAWAGQDASPMWLDQGREYTERWHHQDQIRDAAGVPPLAASRWLRPVIDVSLHALPHAYRDVFAAAGTRIRLELTGPAGGDWTLHRHREGWRLHPAGTSGGACHIRMADLDFARMLLHRYRHDGSAVAVAVDGDASLAAPLLAARAVMVGSVTPDGSQT